MSWATVSELEVASLQAADVWAHYADATRWPERNDALASAELDGPLAVGATARVRFRTGLRLRFRIIEAEEPRVFTDESRLLGARMGHRHVLEDLSDGLCLRNEIYIEGPLAFVWSRVLGPQAKAGLPEWQRKAAELARPAS